ncbi:MAG: hypothetical protein ABL930_09905 [Pseudobdellovibrio sp.]
MPRKRLEKKRILKKENGEIVTIQEADFQKFVDSFRILEDWDKEVFFDSSNGQKLKVRRLKSENANQYAGKHVYISIFIKEQIQGNFYDAYYKLEKVKVRRVLSNGGKLVITGIDGREIQIENLMVFVEHV